MDQERIFLNWEKDCTAAAEAYDSFHPGGRPDSLFRLYPTAFLDVRDEATLSSVPLNSFKIAV
jgi:hypothetical protein